MTGVTGPREQSAFSVPFLSPGVYTVAFTCQGLAEDPDVHDGLAFVAPQSADVVHGEDTVVDFD